MCLAGNRVTFDIEKGKNVSQIYNKTTKVVIPIDDTPKGYEFEMWVKTGSKTPNKKVEEKVKDHKNVNLFENLVSTDFHGLVQAL